MQLVLRRCGFRRNNRCLLLLLEETLLHQYRKLGMTFYAYFDPMKLGYG